MNRTTASIGARKKVRTNPLYQYDYGQKLILKGVTLPETYEVLFGNPGTELKAVLGDEDGVNIPDEFLTNGQNVVAYVFLHTGEDDGETEYEIEIPVTPRAVRSDGEIDPVDQSIITQAIAVLNLAVEKTTDYMTEAKEARDEARGYRDEAQTSEYNAGVSENNAHISENNALEYARRAETAESNVSVIESKVEGYIETATELNEKLEDYSQEVEEAKTDISALSQTEQSSIRSLANTQKDAITTEGSRQIGLVTEEGRAQVQDVIDEGQTQVGLVRTEGGTQITNIEQRGADVLSRIPYFAPIITDTAEGSIASFSDGADDYPMKSVVAQIVPIQEGSGDPSPQNIRSISGWSSVEVRQSGKNLWCDNFADYTQPRDYRILPIKLKEGGKYHVSVKLVGQAVTGVTVGIVKSGNFYSEFVTPSPWVFVNSQGQVQNSNADYTIDSSWADPKLIIYATSESVFSSFFENYEIQLEEGTTATSYEPYQGSSYSIPFKDLQDNPITVYGGEIDVVKGEGKDKMAMVDLGTLDWYKSSSPQRFEMNVPITQAKAPINNDTLANMICTAYKIIDASTILVDFTIAMNTNKMLRVYDSQKYATMNGTQFKEAMSGVMLCYELATPTPIYCEPTEIKTLKGSNNIWADTGDISVEYPADTKLYIDKLKDAIISLGGNI